MHGAQSAQMLPRIHFTHAPEETMLEKAAAQLQAVGSKKNRAVNTSSIHWDRQGANERGMSKDPSPN